MPKEAANLLYEAIGKIKANHEKRKPYEPGGRKLPGTFLHEGNTVVFGGFLRALLLDTQERVALHDSMTREIESDREKEPKNDAEWDALSEKALKQHLGAIDRTLFKMCEKIQEQRALEGHQVTFAIDRMQGRHRVTFGP